MMHGQKYIKLSIHVFSNKMQTVGKGAPPARCSNEGLTTYLLTYLLTPWS